MCWIGIQHSSRAARLSASDALPARSAFRRRVEMAHPTVRRALASLVVVLGVGSGNLARAEIILSDIVGGGDGTGTAPAGNVGISADDGTFRQAHQNFGIGN